MKKMLLGTIALLVFAGCNRSDPSPETIRQNTAKATSKVVQDTKAVAKGVADGIEQQKDHGAVDINRASAADLNALPGVDDARAQKIIDGRPYAAARDLETRHIVTRAEYDQIAGQITVR